MTADDAMGNRTLTDVVVVITGANTGIGLEASRTFAKAGADVIMAARSKAKLDEAVADIKKSVPNAKV